MNLSCLRGTWSAVLMLALGLARPAGAAEPTRAQLEFFETRIRPVLVNHCYECHSQESGKSKGGLLLDTRDAVLKGGNTGPAIVPGRPDESLLVKAVRYTDEELRMPPKDKRLSAEQVADLVRWVEQGAPDPRTTAGASGRTWGKSDRDHWAFQAPRKPVVPSASDPAWNRNPIDAFVATRLTREGLQPNPPADKRTLIRRATFDLTGLPPTPEAVEAFLKDDSADAFAKVVDRLLASPRYGERWARYWLDVARYADTKGDVRRQVEDFRYLFAWTYRDYVIDAYNRDRPFDRFILEQIAADRLVASGAADRTSLAALGFLTLGDRFNGMQHDIINDRIDVVTRGFLGLTAACARCHDHKFDPIPTQDYYSLYGIFASTFEPRELPVIRTRATGPDYTDYLAKYQGVLKDADALTTKAQELRKSKSMDQKARRELLQESQELRNTHAKLEQTHPGAPARAQVLYDAVRPRDSKVFLRGEPGNNGPVAPRRFLEILAPAGAPRRNYTQGSGRLELARDIANRSNPLTARVYVNRVWLHLFGEGIVLTPDDFGTMSAPPSHQDLLDWLAVTFMDQGWSTKKLIRTIMLSQTYQQGSANQPVAAEKDPGNRLLWRANVRRLDFEALRDSLLAIGGRLDTNMHGQAINLAKEPYPTRRTVYGYIDRNNVAEVLYQFDFPNPDLASGRRHTTIVPQQALFMMNSPLVVETARALVHRPDFLDLTGDEEKVAFLYQLVYQRPPTEREVKMGLEFVYYTPAKDSAGANSRGGEPTPAALAKLAKERPLAAKRIQERRRGTAAGPQREPVGAWEKYAHALFEANEASFLN